MKFMIAIILILGATSVQAQQLTRAQIREIRAVCEADIRRVCPGIKPGGGRLLACIRVKKSEVSPPCSEALVALEAAKAPTN